jgi:type IV fimbrial biogenesis protein FimT
VLKARAPQLGFNLVEIAIAMVVLAILISLGAPSFGDWLQNQQTRAAAEAMLNGLQIARAEAVKRNAQVRFQFVNDLTSTCFLSAVNLNWVVSVGDPTSKCDQMFDAALPGPVIQSKSASEVSPNVIMVIAPGGLNPANTVTFNSFGGVLAQNVDGSPPITQVDICNPAITGSNARPLRVVVPAGGSIRMCDPSVTDARDARACPVIVASAC